MRSPVPSVNDRRWADLSCPERALQVAAYECDVLKARESGGPNRGERVKAYLAAAGLDEGFPWCAAFVSYCLREARWADFPTRAASVASWVSWAIRRGRATESPKRGDLFYWLEPSGCGHIGFVVKASLFVVQTIEGNTSSGASGSQRDGDGVYRRLRARSKLRFIRMG